MFKHLAKLFDYEDLASLMNQYERLRASGQTVEATLVRATIANILTNSDETRSPRRRR